MNEPLYFHLIFSMQRRMNSLRQQKNATDAPRLPHDGAGQERVRSQPVPRRHQGQEGLREAAPPREGGGRL